MKILLLIFLLLAGGGRLEAHPHAFIETRLEVIFNDKGEIIALKQEWLFDEIYSADILSRVDSIPALAEKMLNNLKEWDYFNFLSNDEDRQKFTFPSQKESRIEGRKLFLGFTLPLASPFRPGKVVQAIFDPTYYVAIMPQEKEGAVSLKNAPASCVYRIVTPSPSFEMTSLAKAADKNKQGSTDWGFYFADKVEIECP